MPEGGQGGDRRSRGQPGASRESVSGPFPRTHRTARADGTQTHQGPLPRIERAPSASRKSLFRTGVPVASPLPSTRSATLSSAGVTARYLQRLRWCPLFSATCFGLFSVCSQTGPVPVLFSGACAQGRSANGLNGLGQGVPRTTIRSGCGPSRVHRGSPLCTATASEPSFQAPQRASARQHPSTADLPRLRLGAWLRPAPFRVPQLRRWQRDEQGRPAAAQPPLSLRPPQPAP